MVSHTTTGEWQSFEMRMRRRRAERLVMRAGAAADAGCLEEARNCLDEARTLDPALAELEVVEQKLSTAVVAAPGSESWVPSSHEIGESPQVLLPGPDGTATSPIIRSNLGRPIAITAAAALIVGLVAVRIASLPRAVVQPVASSEAGPGDRGAAVEMPRIVSAPEATRANSTDTYARSELGLDRVGVGAAPKAADPPAASDMKKRGQELPVADAKAADPLPQVQTVQSVPAAEAAAGVPRPPEAIAAAPTLAVAAPTPEPIRALELPSPSPPLPPPAREAPAVDPPQEPAVRSALDRYASAYSALDADAAQRVWPGVNRAALSRAFESLASQQIALGDCQIQVAGVTATATCAGTAAWSPKIGGGAHSEPRTWAFELARGGTGWSIVSARVQNR